MITRDVRQAMASLEAARARYRDAVLRSLDGSADGAAIRAALEEFRAAHAVLARCRSGDAEGAPTAVATAGVESRLRRVVHRILRRDVANTVA